MSRFSIAVMMVLAIPAFAAAQHRGGAVGRAPMAPSRPATVIPRAAPAPGHVTGRVQSGTQGGARGGAPVMRAGVTGRTIRHGNSTAFGSNGFGSNGFGSNGFGSNGFGSNGTDFQNVPGLGFDYPHLAAISGNRRGRGEGFGGEVPFGFGGFLGSPSVIVDGGQQPADTQPADTQVSVADQNAAEDARAAADAYYAQRARQQSEGSRVATDTQPQSAPAPLQDVEQYVFVRRDGGLVFAVAYSWENGTLTYVTPDGLRRSMSRDALDINATQQFNEQRGLNFRAPA